MLAEIKHRIHQYGLSKSLDQAKFWYYQLKNFPSNRAFLKAHPNLVFPPKYTLYESYGLDYKSYWEGGLRTAKWITDTFQEHTDLSNAKILDWGCGPARVVRHLPTLLQDAVIYGTDYNKDTIMWCQGNIPGIDFRMNNLAPPLDFPDNFFDAIYGISILTHLNRSNHSTWLKELYRKLKDNGLLLITTQGMAHTKKLTESERVSFSKGEIVIRKGINEGHLTFSAFQPDDAMRKLLSGNFEVLTFTPGQQETWGTGQDVWMLKKI